MRLRDEVERIITQRGDSYRVRQWQIFADLCWAASSAEVQTAEFVWIQGPQRRHGVVTLLRGTYRFYAGVEDA